MELAMAAATASLAPLALLATVLCLSLAVRRLVYFMPVIFVILAGIFGCIIADVWASHYVKGDNLQLLGLECFVLSVCSFALYAMALVVKSEGLVKSKPKASSARDGD